MWQAIIDSKSDVNGVVIVGVVYTNGVTKTLEAIDMTGGSMDTLNNRIQSRLNTLDANDLLLGSIVLGPFTPTTKPQTDAQIFQAALNHFQSCERCVDRGLIQKTDKEYTDAQAAMIAAFNVSFIDLV